MTETFPRRPTKSWWLAGVALVALVAVGGILVLWRTARGTEGPAPGGASATTQTNDGGQVTVKVTRQDTSAGFAFAVVLDTHAVDLDGYDLGKLATLRVGETELQASGWSAPAGGHHRQGTLSFPATAATGPVELIIRDIAGIPARSFQWPKQ